VKLRALRLRHVRRFGAEGAALEEIADGVNVLAAPNEVGKSTLLDALRCALFFKATSRHRDVSSLVPDPGGGQPEIEIDLDHDGGAFRLAKRFAPGGRARVSERASDRTVAEGEAVQDWLAAVLRSERRDAGPPGLLWVTQGESLAAPGDAATTLEGLLEREVGDVVGGERARAVLERARGEYERLMTPSGRQPRAGGPYATAIDRRRALDAEIAELERRTAASERTREAVAEIDARLRTLTDAEEDARLDGELAAARRVLDAARAAADRLRVRHRELEAARAEETRRATAADALAEAQRAAEATLARRASTRAAVADAAARRERAEAAEAAARETRDAARAELEAARAARERATRAAAAERAAAALDALRARLAQARAAGEERARLAAERRGIRLDEATLAALEARRDAWREAAGRARAARPTVTVHYAADAAGRVRGADGPLAADRPLTVARRTELALDGIGTLVVDPGGAKDAADAELAARDEEARLRAALAEHGVDDVAGARAQLQAAARLDARLDELARELERLAPDGLDALAAELAQAESRLADRDPDAPDPRAAEAAEAAAYTTLEAAEQRWRAALDTLHRARETAGTAAAEAALLEERTREIRAELGPEDGWPERLAAARRELEDARKARAAAAASHAEAEREAGDVPAAEAQVRRLDEALANRRAERERLARERAERLGELRATAAEGLAETLAGRVEERVFWAGREDALGHHVAALERLMEAIETAERAARERYTAPVVARLAPLVRTVLPDGEVELADDFAPARLARGERVDPLARLSGGTREQLAILSRLGFARLMAERGREIPVVLDDAIVFSDDRRIERMFDALTLAGDAVQVLVLTCRERAFARLGGRPLRLAPWPASER
jgi:hypothetical protein